MTVSDADLELLRRAIALSAAARAAGEAPYGSLLADADGTVLVEAHNTVIADRDITAHPELKLALWASRELDFATARTTTMFTSCQPCGMCTGAIERSGLGRVVYALTGEQSDALEPSNRSPVTYAGPALYDEAVVPFAGLQ